MGPTSAGSLLRRLGPARAGEPGQEGKAGDEALVLVGGRGPSPEEGGLARAGGSGGRVGKAGLPVAAAKLAAGGHDENAGPAAGVAGAAAASAGGGHDGKSGSDRAGGGHEGKSSLLLAKVCGGGGQDGNPVLLFSTGLSLGGGGQDGKPPEPPTLREAARMSKSGGREGNPDRMGEGGVLPCSGPGTGGQGKLGSVPRAAGR